MGSRTLARRRTRAAVGVAFALCLLIPSCGSDEDGANGGGAGTGAGTNGASGGGTGGAGTGGGGTGGGGAAGATGSGGAGAAGAGGSSGSAGSSGAAGSPGGSAGSSGRGGAAGRDAGQNDAGNPDAGACGALGAGCDVSCAQGFECMQGVCIPQNRARCGGIVAMDCPESFPICMMCNGCEGGPCFRESEIACLCRGVGRTVFRCDNR